MGIVARTYALQLTVFSELEVLIIPVVSLSFISHLNGSPANAEKMTKLRFMSKVCKEGSPDSNH